MIALFSIKSIKRKCTYRFKIVKFKLLFYSDNEKCNLSFHTD